MADLSLSNDGDDYHRVLRTRSRRVSSLLEQEDTVGRLIIASVTIGPVERVMFLSPNRTFLISWMCHDVSCAGSQLRLEDIVIINHLSLSNG